MKALALASVASLLFLANGCVVDHHHNHSCAGSGCNVPLGDISFDWGFQYTDGLTHYCDEAVIDVRTVHIEIIDITNGIYDPQFTDNQPCGAVGVTVTDFIPGDYQINLDGASYAESYVYTGTFYVTVDAGLNNYGLLVLK